MYDIGSIIVVKEQSAVVIEAVKLTLSPWAAWIVRRQQIAANNTYQVPRW